MPLSALATRRIMRDINSVDNLKSQGIYYIPDETQISRGVAMCVGSAGTPYVGGFYFFSIEFPDDYPYTPIRVRSLTQDGVTRFNPNMYLDGKVCLSILNTWHDGPQWSAIQTLESVLLAIMSAVLNANPLENEPCFRGCGPTSPDAISYNRIILHANIWTAVHGMLVKPPAFAAPFADAMRAEFVKYKDAVLAACEAEMATDGSEEVSRAFGMRVRYRWKDAAAAVRSLGA